MLAGFDGGVVVIDGGQLLGFVSAGDVAGLSLSTVGGWLGFVSAGDVAELSLSTVGGRWRARAPVTWRSCAVRLVLSEGEGVGGWHYSPASSNADPCRRRRWWRLGWLLLSAAVDGWWWWWTDSA